MGNEKEIQGRDHKAILNQHFCIDRTTTKIFPVSKPMLVELMIVLALEMVLPMPQLIA